MPVLILLRHAKSSWDDPGLADFDRPLAPRGQRAAPAMGAEMATRGWTPDFALVSPAKRAAQTWSLAAAQFAAPVAMHFEDRIYEASADSLLALARDCPAGTQVLAMVGHNPGMEMFALMLAAADSDPAMLNRMRNKYPTAAIARFQFTGAWADLAARSASLTDFLRPRDLA